MATDTGISFLNVDLVELSFKINRKFKPSEVGIPVEVDFNVKHFFAGDNKTLYTTLSSSLFPKSANRPFSMTVSVDGVFTSNDPEKLRNFAAVHAPSHLMPFIREIIGNTTMKAGIQPLLLPPINMQEALSNKKGGDEGTGKERGVDIRSATEVLPPSKGSGRKSRTKIRK